MGMLSGMNGRRSVRCDNGGKSGLGWRKAHLVFLAFLGMVYLIRYFAHPALPGNNPEYPLGWWAWSDQGEYLKAAKAAASLDFSASNYFYPPIYPLLGSLFVRWNPMHAFALLDIVCFIAFAHYFVSFARRYVGWPWAMCVLVMSLISAQEISAVWIEPWTSTLVAATYAFLFFDVGRLSESNEGIDYRRLAIWGGCGGLIFATRPVDAVAIAPLFIFVLLYVFRSHARSGSMESLTFQMLALLSSGLFGVAFFVGFNVFVHGSPGGAYFAASRVNGFYVADLFEKSVSMLLDSGSIYNVPSEAFFAKLKWLALVVPAALYGVLRGPAMIRLLITVAVAQLLLYLPYSNLLPTGLWRYHNIHYFKWLIPYAALLILWWAKHFLSRDERGGQSRSLWLSVVVGSLLLCVQIELKELQTINAAPDKVTHILRVPLDRPDAEIDKITMPSLNGDSKSVYFGKGVAVKLDGEELRYAQDYRFLPAEEGVDLIFVRPVRGSSLEIDPGALAFEDSSFALRLLQYGFSIGKPTWLGLNAKPTNDDAKARLGLRYSATLEEGIDFSRPGYPRFLADAVGISGQEPSGRWSETGPDGRVAFVFKKPLPRQFSLIIVANVFGPNTGKPIRVKVGSWEQTFVVPGGANSKAYELVFSNPEGASVLEVFVPQPVRPKDILPGNLDSRLLGVWFVSLKILAK